jgi:hypothetical protein
MPSGDPRDNYAVFLIVQIYDDNDGYATFKIPTPIYVMPNEPAALAIADGIRTNDPNCKPCSALKANTMSVVVQILTSVISSLDGGLNVQFTQLNTTNVNFNFSKACFKFRFFNYLNFFVHRALWI